MSDNRTEKKERKCCSDLPSDAHRTHICCDSCHEDCEAGYGDLLELDRGDALWVVCCNKANYLDGKRNTR